MPITYIQKQKILEFLSNPANWKNHFDLDFFMDEKRKWHTQSKNGITVSTSNDKKEIFVVHEQTGSAVHIKKEAPKLSIRDESGRGLSIQSKLLKLDDGTALTIEPITSAREFNQDTQDTNIAEIDEMGVRIGFHNSGLKTVFLADSGQKITFEKPTSPIKSTSHPGQFFHVISFSLTTAKTWGMEPSDLLDATKLVVSKDMDLEPGLRTLNDLDPAQVHKYFEYLLTDEYDQTYNGPWQWRPKITKISKDLFDLQKAWHDSTEYSGHFIDTPHQFFVQTKDDAFDLATSLDDRERIWSFGHVFKSATCSNKPPIQMVSMKTPTHTLLHMLNKGDTARDHRNREWAYIIIETKDAPVVSEQTRAAVKDNFHLTGNHASVINFDNNLCILAMDCDALEKTKLALNASREMLSLINSGKADVDLMHKLLEQGADLRFVDHEAAQAGRTFANEMKSSGNIALLNALESAQGIHDLQKIPTGP